jgi:hypothetical protein
LIGEAIGRDEQTIFRIVEDYERAATVQPILLKELERQRIDPAARRNASIVENLAQEPASASPKEAARIVSVVLKADNRRKQAFVESRKRKTSEDFIPQIISLFTKRYVGMPPQQAQAEMKRVLVKVAEGLGIDIVSPPVSAPKPPKSTTAA